MPPSWTYPMFCRPPGKKRGTPAGHPAFYTASSGTGYEMDAIAACVVGGVSAYGGSGNVFGMVVGATLIGVINLGMSLMGIDANWQKVVKGIVLLAAVVFDIVANKKNAK